MVIEVAQGVPFTSVTATVTINGGTFSDGTTAVTILKGETQSVSFPYTVTDISAIITVSNLMSDPGNILDGITSGATGYEGFKLASGAALNVGDGVCGRTPQVRDAIVAALSDVDDCRAVTNALLTTIDALDLTDPTPNDGAGETEDDIATLKSGDFAGLTALATLNLSSNALEGLPADIFADLAALATLDVSSNGLAGLPADIFIDLGALMTLDVSSNALTELDTDVFAALSALTTLNMSGNSALSMLDANLFVSLSALTTLDVSSNGLGGLPAGLFSGIENADFNGLTALTTLNLSDNNISELPAGVFSGLMNLTGVDVSGNPKDAAELFTLTATAVLTTEPSDGVLGMAVVEVVQGAPFEVTATVTISGGTFPNGAPSVTLATGATHSDAFAVATE